ncbi:DNA-3-methyladenine glycosylase I [Planktotalea sp.]|uniref:DNA-3-methyladenine glycosylase I n=1 Tax=Planktotalea sp. TaxID=2029877 RepID=UPI003D6B9B7B
MRTFEELYDIAHARHGDALTEKIGNSPDQAPLLEIPEDRWLSMFTRMVFCAGFNWKVIDAKWEGFEAAFYGFDVGRCAFMDDEWLDELLRDTRIVRYGAKIQAVRDNAVFLMDLREQGGAGQVIGGWPATDFIGLLALMKAKGNRLGGTTGQYGLRLLGKDSFILSKDVVARLVAEGVIEKTPTSKKALRATQDAFNEWMEQSGKSLTYVSRVAALSV